MKQILWSLLLPFLIAGCAEKSEKLLPVPDYSGLKKEAKQDLGEFINFNPAVDILFVIDDSGSMDLHQANLAKNIDQFIGQLSANAILDWRVGVVNSSSFPKGYGTLRGTPNFVDKTTPQFETRMRQNLIVGTNGDPEEVFIQAVTTAVSPTSVLGKNAGFFRPDALLAIFIITDTEDHGTVNPTDAVAALKAFKGGDADRLLAYAVLANPRSLNCKGEGEEPYRIREFVNALNGKLFDLCDPQFGNNLAAVGADIVENIEMTIRLKQRPVVSTLQVWYGSQKIENDWSTGWGYDPQRNAIVFSKDMKLKPEPKGTQIQVKFTSAILK